MNSLIILFLLYKFTINMIIKINLRIQITKENFQDVQFDFVKDNFI